LVVDMSMSTQLRSGLGSRLTAVSLLPGTLFRIAGTGLLWATAALHLDLYLTGYRTIPTIGWLFLLQIVAGFLLGGLVLVSRSRLVAGAGALFALATLGGYLLTVQFGLFGFREVRTTAGIVAGIIEVAAFAVLASYAATDSGESGGKHGHRMPPRVSLSLSLSPMQAGLGVAGVSVLALGLMGGALAGAGSATVVSQHSTYGAQGNAGSVLRTTRIGGVTVLTNAGGRTLYWFAPDTPTKSMCNGSCAVYWPPVSGPLTAGPGVTGRLGTIRRADGSIQETYDGHPLYTYVSDSAPGQDRGNNLDLNGGYWHVMPVSG
jgi:predicted lipoprotein with Yx(FWY)xxD motif